MITVESEGRGNERGLQEDATHTHPPSRFPSMSSQQRRSIRYLLLYYCMCSKYPVTVTLRSTDLYLFGTNKS